MKARISNNLRGTIVLPSISKFAMVQGREFDISDDQYWSDDIQIGIKKGLVIVTDGEPPDKVYHKIKNIGFASIILPTGGILRSGHSTEINAIVAENPQLLGLIADKKVSIEYNSRTDVAQKTHVPVKKVEKRKAGRPRVRPLVQPTEDVQNEEHHAVVMKPSGDGEVSATKTSMKKNKQGSGKMKTSTRNNTVVIEHDESDEIQFVDQIEERGRLAKHPVLSKQAQKEVDDIEFVDEQEIDRRIAQHPVLKNRKND